MESGEETAVVDLEAVRKQAVTETIASVIGLLAARAENLDRLAGVELPLVLQDDARKRLERTKVECAAAAREFREMIARLRQALGLEAS
jgi:hypothetical protein